jgi:hypothetical protein
MRDFWKDNEYVGSMKASQITGKGVGYIAERGIRSGYLILREKPFAATSSQELTNSMGLLIDFSSKICLAGNELVLAGKIMRLLQKSNVSRSAFFKLWDGTERRQVETVEVDGNLIIDMLVVPYVHIFNY